ncbi:MAG: hypothetical protein WCG27_11135 [Pseudomonadota bacterium]
MTNFPVKKISFLSPTLSWITIFTIAIVWIFLKVFHGEYNQDEFQHSHIIWNILQGKKMYVDFFDNHGFLYHYLCAFFIKFLGIRPSLDWLTYFRGLSIFLLICYLMASYRLARQLVNPLFAVVVLLFLTTSSIVFYTGPEIRPDVLQNIFILLGLVEYFKPRRSKYSPFWLALWWTLAIITNFKSIINFAAFLICHFTLYRQDKKYSLHLLYSISLLSLILIIYLLGNGSLSHIWYCGFWGNIVIFFTGANPDLANGIGEGRIIIFKDFINNYLIAHTGHFILYTMGLYHLFKNGSHPFKFLAMYSLLLFIFLPFLWSQFGLSFIPVLSLLAVYGLSTIANDNLRKLVFCFTLCWSLIHGTKSLLNGSSQIKQEQENILSFVLENIPRNSYVYALSDSYLGAPAIVFNQDWDYFWHLIPQHYKLYKSSAQGKISFSYEHFKNRIGALGDKSLYLLLPPNNRDFKYDPFPFWYGVSWEKFQKDVPPKKRITIPSTGSILLKY